MKQTPGQTPGTESLEEFFEGAPCGLLVTSPEGMILAVNGTFLDWTGFRREELVGARALEDLLTVPSRIYYETHLAPLLRIQGFAHEIAVDLVRRDGRPLPTFINASEKRNQSGEPLLVRVAVFDASDRRKYERELLMARRTSEEAARAKADFLAMFAHEIRNPLGAVMLQAQILERKDLAPEHQALVKRIFGSLRRMLALINNMLDVSRLESGKVAVEQTPFGLEDVAHAVVLALLPLADQKGLTVDLRIDTSLPPRLTGDPVKLEQVLTNLVGNAIKFTPDGTVTMAISLERLAGEIAHVAFRVEDTGIGIPREKQPMIFEAYAQADASISRRFGGTGLGLAITRRLVETFGGTLALESEPGRGSVFSFSLAMKVAAPESRRAVE